MRLTSITGDDLVLLPLRHVGRWETVSEDSWIVVRGDVRLANGRSWSFEDDCMQVRDLPQVERWLRGVVDGTVSPRGWDHFDPRDSVHPVLDFLEPNLAFRLVEPGDARCILEVAFFVESHPEYAENPDRSDIEPFYLRLDVAIQDVKRAAEEWHEERQRYSLS